MLARKFMVVAAFAAAIRSLFAAESFTIAAYNVENLHDADGVAVYDDYQPDTWGAPQLVTKVKNIAAVLAKFRGGAGPDVVLLQEVEVDQTPGSTVGDVDAFLASQADVTLTSLAQASPLLEPWKGAPAEAWLGKALREAGLTGYHIVVGSDGAEAGSGGSRPAIKCVTLTKFPVRAVREYPVESARNILETELEVDGHPLYVFNNHWKSGAGDAKLETVRVQNAEVLRRRLDALLAADPHADIVIGGDFNSQYNQKPRYPDMPRTGMNDVLRAQGSEVALEAGKAEFYNLWFELPAPARGSDVYKGEWGTLMNLIVSRGLYDWAGVQYQDNSFRVARIVGFNADAAGVPRRWDSSGPAGSGFSDHLPVYAHFRTVDANAADKFMPLDKPSDETAGPETWRVNYAAIDLKTAVDLASLPKATDLRDGSWNGKLFKVVGAAIVGRNLRVRCAGQVYDIYAPNRAVREKLEQQAGEGREFRFYGELGTYKGNWQFVIEDLSWVP